MLVLGLAACARDAGGIADGRAFGECGGNCCDDVDCPVNQICTVGWCGLIPDEGIDAPVACDRRFAVDAGSPWLGSACIGAEVEFLVVICNVGDCAAEPDVVFGAMDDEVTLDWEDGPLAPGQCREARIVYEPVDTDADVATLIVDGEFVIDLLSEFVGEPLLAYDPMSLDFGVVAPGEPVALLVTVANLGDGNLPLTVESVAIDGVAADLVTIDTSLPLPAWVMPAPCEPATLAITLTATAGACGATLDGTLTITTDAGEAAVTLTGAVGCG